VTSTTRIDPLAVISIIATVLFFACLFTGRDSLAFVLFMINATAWYVSRRNRRRDARSTG
jgi:positive regulator of sigma E activity